MRINEWKNENPKFDTSIDISPAREITFILKSNGIEAKRTMPMMQVPFDQDEIVLEDYICTIFENLKHKLEVDMNTLNREQSEKLLDHYIQNIPHDLSDEEFANEINNDFSNLTDEIRKDE